MTSRFQVIPAAYVVLRRQVDGAEQVLLQLRAGTGYRDGFWAAAAAGHVEAGESVVQAACREVCEELGVRIDPADLDPLLAMHRTQGNGDPVDERVDFFFTCRHWQGEPRRMEPHKSADLRWFDLDALPDPLVPHERYVLEGLRRGGLPAVVAFGFADSPPAARAPDGRVGGPSAEEQGVATRP